MTPEELEKVQYYAKQIAQILYSDTDPTTIQSLGAIETVVRQKLLESVSPEIGVFLSKKPPRPQPEDLESSKQASGRSPSRKSKLKK
jgi:hypothetical protein